jgi:hypothetical protein
MDTSWRNDVLQQRQALFNREQLHAKKVVEAAKDRISWDHRRKTDEIIGLLREMQHMQNYRTEAE